MLCNSPLLYALFYSSVQGLIAQVLIYMFKLEFRSVESNENQQTCESQRSNEWYVKMYDTPKLNIGWES